MNEPTKKPGRPKSGGMTAAERMKKFRATHVQVKVGEKMSATIRAYAQEFDIAEGDVAAELIRFALMNRDWWQEGFPIALSKYHDPD